jgi:hypothetical protein
VGLKYSILATEGAHDQAALCKLLRMFGLEIFKGNRKTLDTFWLDIVPQRKEDDSLYSHNHVHLPYFFTSQTHSVAVYQGRGSSLSQNISDIMTLYPSYARNIHALGIIVDADTKLPHEVAKMYTDKLSTFFPGISNIPGIITAPSISEKLPRTGIYVLPDNNKKGTLDSMLVECASHVYPDHKAGAEVFLSSLDLTHKSHWKPFDYEKAVIATIASVIHPGIANTLSIARDNWVCDQTINAVSSLAHLCKFISDLLELSLQ